MRDTTASAWIIQRRLSVRCTMIVLADVMHVSVGTEKAIIPNLRYIEERLLELGNPF